MTRTAKDRTDRSAWHEHDGSLTVNGRIVPSQGVCARCGGRLYVQFEVDLGKCVDCLHASKSDPFAAQLVRP